MTAPVREFFDHEQLNRLNALVATIAWLGDMVWLPDVDATTDLPATWEAGQLCLVKADGCVYTYSEDDSDRVKVAIPSS